MTQRIWNKAAVHELLERNPAALAKAVLTIYGRQTADERAIGETTDHNKRGFSGFDAAFLSDIAVKLPRYDMRLTPAQRARVLPKMKRYWRQLLEEIEAKGNAVCYKATVAKERNPDVAEDAPTSVAPPIALNPRAAAIERFAGAF